MTIIAIIENPAVTCDCISQFSNRVAPKAGQVHLYMCCVCVLQPLKAAPSFVYLTFTGSESCIQGLAMETEK